MKSNDGIPSPHGSKNDGMCFLGNSLNKLLQVKNSSAT